MELIENDCPAEIIQKVADSVQTESLLTNEIQKTQPIISSYSNSLNSIKVNQSPPVGKNLTSESAKLTTENAKVCSDKPVEELLGSLTTFNPQGAPEQPLRTSARVIKKMRLDSLVSPGGTGICPVFIDGGVREKKDFIKCEDRDCKPKVRPQKALWSVNEKNLFFEALNEYGKDFEAITQFLGNKLKRRGIPDSVLKTKDQVRHFYYRTWHKISKHLKFSSEIKKVVQEIYALINYGEMRKKLFSVNEKTAVKLSELIYRGSIQLRLKGKSVRVKTPMCKALRKLNQMEEWQEELKLPTRVAVELRPGTLDAWTRVQSVAHNPRVVSVLPLQRRLSTLLTLLQEKWKSRDVRTREKLFESNMCKLEMSENECAVVKDMFDPEQIFHVVPKPGININKPVINLSEYLTSYRICLNSYEDRVGIVERSETLFTGGITSFKGGGGKKTIPKRQRSDAAGDKKPVNDIENDIDAITMNCDKIDLEADLEASKIVADNDVSNSVLQINNIDHLLTPETNYFSDADDKDLKVSDFDDDFIDDDCDLKLSKIDKHRKKENLKIIRKRDCMKKEEQHFKTAMSEEALANIRQGWTTYNSGDLTLGDMYLMFGYDSKIQLEYWWDIPQKELLNKSSSDESFQCDNSLHEITTDNDTNGLIDQNEDLSVKADVEVHQLTKESILNSELLTENHNSSMENNNLYSSFVDTRNEQETAKISHNLSYRLKQLLSLAALHEKGKLKSSCSCGHLCGDKGTPTRKTSNKKPVVERTDSVVVEQSQQSFVSTKNITTTVTDGGIFLPPLPIATANRQHVVAHDSFKTHLNSLQKIKPRWCNRRGRTVRSKQVVVQRMLPLLPKSIPNGFVTMNVVPQLEVLPINRVQPRTIAPRQLSFGHETPQTTDTLVIGTKINESMNTPVGIIAFNIIDNTILNKEDTTITPTAESNVDYSNVVNISSNNCTTDKTNDGCSSTISNLLDFSLPSTVADDISLGAVANNESESNKESSFVGLLDQNLAGADAVSQAPSLSPSQVLTGSENAWFNTDIHDFSLSSFLGHLDSPAKHLHHSTDDTRLSQDVDNNLQSLMGESSIDYMAKFAALAAQMANDNGKKT